MKAVRVVLGSVVALSLVACASSGPSSSGTSTPPGAETTAGGTKSAPSTGGGATTSSAPASTTPAGTTAPTTSGATSTTTAPAQDVGDKLAGPYVLVFKQSGGIAGLRMETVIDSAAKTMTYGGMRNQNRETRSLSAQEVASITALVNAAGLAMLEGQLKGAAPSDAFAYEIHVETGGRKRALTWSDGAKVPAPVSHLQSAIVKLRDEKFGAGTPKGAPTM